MRRQAPTLQELQGRLRAAILESAARHGIPRVRVFGSVARGNASPASDIDFAVDVQPGCSVLALGGFLADMEELLEARVDVIEGCAARGALAERLEREAVVL